MTTYRPEYDMKVVGRNLRRLREAKKLSVDEVREYLCLGSVQAIYKYEKGKGYPQADTMFALMELYEANLYDITRTHEEDEQSSSACFMEHMNVARYLESRKGVIPSGSFTLNYAFNDRK